MKKRTVRKGLCLLALLSVGMFSRAGELSLLIKPINPFQFSSAQVFTPVTILNTGSGKVEAYISVQIKSQGGNPVAEFRSASFTINPGTLDFGMAAPQLLASSYQNVAFRDYERRNASFPSGNYQYCAELTNQATGEITRLCSEFDLQGLNPATLIYPEDESHLDEPGMIQFSWVPCTPPKSRMFYSFKLVELYEDQPANEAVKRNPPLQQISGLGTSIYMYPATAPKLTAGKKYAWQVECYEEFAEPEMKPYRHAAVSSEVFWFSVGKEEVMDSILFAKPKRVQDASFSSLKDGKLYFTFHSEYIQGKLDYSIKDAAQKDIPVMIRRIDEQGNVAETPIVLKGDNKYELTLNGSMPPEGIYTLEIKDLKGISYYLRIKL